MDLMAGLAKTLGNHDSNRVIGDKLTKSAHFITVRVDYTSKQLTKIYVKDI